MNKFKTNAMWSAHNLVSHPLSEILHLLSCICFKNKLRAASNWVHDITIPKHNVGEGRG